MMTRHLAIMMGATERLLRCSFFHYKASMAVHDRALATPLGLHVRAGGTVGKGGTKRCRKGVRRGA